MHRHTINPSRRMRCGIRSRPRDCIAVLLLRMLDNDITAEYTVTERAVVYRFKFPSTAKPHLAWTLQPGVEVAPVGLTALQGSGVTDGVRRIVCRNIQPFAPPNPGLVQVFRVAGQPTLLAASVWISGALIPPNRVRLAISYISTDQARRNLIRECRIGILKP